MTETSRPKYSAAVQSLSAIALTLPGMKNAHADQIIKPKTSFQYVRQDNGKKRYRFDIYNLLLETPLTSKSDFSFQAGKDVMSGATYVYMRPATLDTLNPGSYNTLHEVRTGPTISDYRNALSGTARYFAELATVGVSANFSNESDYKSRGGGIQLEKDFNDKNTLLGFQYAFSLDRVHPMQNAQSLAPSTIRGYRPSTRHRQSHIFNLSVTQDLTDKNYIVQTFQYEYDKGYLSDPYTLSFVYGNASPIFVGGAFIPFLPGAPVPRVGFTLIPDLRPRHKSLYTSSTKFVQYIKCFDSAVHFTYRFIHNDWKINSHTFMIDYYQPFLVDYEWSFGVRYYTQNNAKFYYVTFYAHSKPTFDSKKLRQYASSDYRLARFGDITYQAKISRKFMDNKNGTIALIGGITDRRNRYYWGSQMKTPNPENNYKNFFVSMQLNFEM